MTANLEYEKLFYDATKRFISNSDDTYTKLMKKEQTVLDVVNKVVNQKEASSKSGSFIDKSLRQIVYNTYIELIDIIKDIQEQKHISKIISTDRYIPIGIFLVTVSTMVLILYSFD